MKPKLFPLVTLFALSCLVILQSCVVPDEDGILNCDDSTEHYSLSEDQKKIIPYTGYDTISMVSNTGDTIHCIGTGKQYFTTREFQPYGNPECAGHGTEKLYEAYKIAFVDSNKNVLIQLSHYKLKEFPPNYLPFLQTTINDIVEIDFNNNLYYIQDFQISNSKVIEFYYEELALGGSVYKKLTKIEKDYYQDSSSFLYINKTEGIIQFSSNQTQVWSLLR